MEFTCHFDRPDWWRDRLSNMLHVRRRLRPSRNSGFLGLPPKRISEQKLPVRLSRDFFSVIFSSQKPPMTPAYRADVLPPMKNFLKQEFGGSARPFTVPIDKIRASIHELFTR